MQVPCEQPGNFGRPAIACVWDDFWGNIAAHDRISPWLRSTEPRHEKTVLLSPALLISTALLSKSYIPKRTVPTGLSQPPPHQALLGQAGLVFDVFHNPPLHHHHQPRPTPPCPSAFSNQVMSRAQSKLCFNFRLHILHEFLSPNRSQSKLSTPFLVLLVEFRHPNHASLLPLNTATDKHMGAIGRQQQVNGSGFLLRRLGQLELGLGEFGSAFQQPIRVCQHFRFSGSVQPFFQSAARGWGSSTTAPPAFLTRHRYQNPDEFEAFRCRPG